MDNNNNNRRGRGRGRGSFNNRGGNNNAYNNNQHNQDVPSILSRLGPTNPTKDSNNNNNNNNDYAYNKNSNYNNYNSNNNNRTQDNNGHSQQNKGGRTFGRGRGRGFKNPTGDRFNQQFLDEDIDMNFDANAGGDNVVIVTGFPPGSENKILPFLKRKSTKFPWEALDVQYANDAIYITVPDEQAIRNVCKMNNYEFGGGKLRISRNKSDRQPSGTQAREKKPPSTAGSSQYMADFLKDRFDPSSGFMNLDNLPVTKNPAARVLGFVLDDVKLYYNDAIITFSFGYNKLWSVYPLRKLPDYYPNLQNLSLEGNDIAEFHSLELFANKFPQLKELVLVGNPIQSLPQYRQEVLKMFPSIQSLDNESIGGTPLPVPVRSNFFDQPSTSMVAQDLLSKYFTLFDTNRMSLGDLYDAQSVFSCVFSNGNIQQQSSWGSKQVLASQRMVFGNENIIKRFAQLPGTIHDLSSADNFMTDAWQTQSSQTHPVVLFLNVHGEFTETPIGSHLSFDRAFLVAPSIPGSRAHSAGWSYTILSDSLVVRNFSCKPASLVTG